MTKSEHFAAYRIRSFLDQWGNFPDRGDEIYGVNDKVLLASDLRELLQPILSDEAALVAMAVIERRAYEAGESSGYADWSFQMDEAGLDGCDIDTSSPTECGKFIKKLLARDRE